MTRRGTWTAGVAAFGLISIATMARAEQVLTAIADLERRCSELATPSVLRQSSSLPAPTSPTAGTLHPCRHGARSRGCCWCATGSASCG
jgi:hypothetical protein